MQNINELVYKMLTESTGTHFLDSGGDDGRHWQRNRNKTLQDFENEKEVEVDIYFDNGIAKLDDVNVYISIFHYLCNTFELDSICNTFNKKFDVMSDYDGEFNFISTEAENYLIDMGFTATSERQNTYNWDNYFSQDVLYTPLKCGDDEYYLISIHNGADVRGGYTDAKLFKLPFYKEFPFISCNIWGNIDGVAVNNFDDGFSLGIDRELDIDPDTFEVKESSVIQLELC